MIISATTLREMVWPEMAWIVPMGMMVMRAKAKARRTPHQGKSNPPMEQTRMAKRMLIARTIQYHQSATSGYRS
jgi:hypothetical protein